MSREQHERARRAAYRDFLVDDGFVPGLKPRIHAGSPAEFLARYDMEPAADRSAEEPALGFEQWKERIRRLPWASSPTAFARRREDPADPEARRSGSRAAAAGMVKRRLRRLADARRDVDAFEPRSPQQRELLGLLSGILGYLEANHRIPGGEQERERWWRIFAAFRRALEFPELTGPRRRAAFEALMGLTAEDLFAVARKGRMGRRMPNRRSTRRNADV